MKSLLPKKALSFKSFNGHSILYNKYILYLFLAISLVDIFYLTSIEDYTSASVFIITAFLVSFFNKNMIVILFLALVVTHILKGGTKIAYEGMENTDVEESSSSPAPSDKEGISLRKSHSSDNDDQDGISNGEFVDNLIHDNDVNDDSDDSGSAKKGANVETTYESDSDDKKKHVKKTSPPRDIKAVNGEMKEFYDLQQQILKGLSDIDPLLSRAENFVEKMQNRK